MAKKRKREDNSLYLRKDGRWERRYAAGRDEKDRSKTKNVLVKTKEERAAKLEAPRKSSESLGLERPRGEVTFEIWMDR